MKKEVTKTLYSNLSSDDVSEYVILTGDPWRADKVAKVLDPGEHISFCRDFYSHTGFYKDLRITVSSTGIGAASAVEILEELKSCGAKVVLRMGSGAPANDEDFAKFLIATAGMADDSVSINYAPENYPIVVDPKLVESIKESVSESGYEYISGIVRTGIAGESLISLTKFGAYRRSMTPKMKTFEELRTEENYLGIKYSDLESPALIKVGNLMGIAVGSICLATVVRDRYKKIMHSDPAFMQSMEDVLCLVALNSLFIYDQKSGKSAKAINE